MTKITIIPKKLSFNEIKEIAEKFRKEMGISHKQIPFPIESIIEFKLKLVVIPVAELKSKGDIDGFLSKDLKSIYIDSKMYNDDRYRLRLNFTYAHEVGHLYLHSEEISQINFENAEDWIKFRNEMDETNLNWFEQQANEFAGRLLVPIDPLVEMLNTQRANIEKYRKFSK